MVGYSFKKQIGTLLFPSNYSVILFFFFGRGWWSKAAFTVVTAVHCYYWKGSISFFTFFYFLLVAAYLFTGKWCEIKCSPEWRLNLCVQQMVLQPVETTTTQLIMNLIKKSLVEEDKFVIVRGKVVCVWICMFCLFCWALIFFFPLKIVCYFFSFSVVVHFVSYLSLPNYLHAIASLPPPPQVPMKKLCLKTRFLLLLTKGWVEQKTMSVQCLCFLQWRSVHLQDRYFLSVEKCIILRGLKTKLVCSLWRSACTKTWVPAGMKCVYKT